MKVTFARILFTVACLFLAPVPQAQAQAADPAILRCDPAVILYKVDGKTNTQGGQRGTWFKECEIPLIAGAHTLEVCYDVGSTTMNLITYIHCDKPREISFESVSGRTYRLKVEISDKWKAWVEDVTEAEAEYSYAQRPKKPKPENKAERKTTVILQVSPANAIPRFYSGKMLGPWFVPSISEQKAENTGIAKAAPDGYVVLTADAGANLTVANVRILGGSVFIGKIYFACDNYQSRVFEDIAGGKVLYLGHMHLDGNDVEQRVTWSDDIDSARKYVDFHFPKLAGKLEPTPHTSRRLPQVCVEFPRVLTNAP